MTLHSLQPPVADDVVAVDELPPPTPLRPVRAIAAALGAEFAGRAGALDLAGGFPAENFERLRETGLLHMALPPEFGGRDADMRDAAHVLHEISKGCPSTALILNMHFALTGQLAHMWRTEPTGIWGRWLQKIADKKMLVGGALSESASWNGVIFPQTRAVRVEGGWRVTGDRSFCTGSSELQLFQCTAQYDAQDGETRCIYFLISEREGVEFKNDWNTLGMRGSHSQGLRLKEVFVADDEVVYDYAYGGVDLSQLWLSFLAWSFIGFASVYSGIADHASEASVQLLFGRARAPGTHGLTHKPSVQLHAAEMQVLNATMDSIRETTGARYPNGTPISIQTIIDTSIAKQICVTKAPKVVDHAMSMIGGQTYFKKLPFERLARDVRAGPFHPFSADDSLEMMGKFRFGLPFLEPTGWAL